MPQSIPKRPVNPVPAKKGDIFSLGTITIRVMEDGSRTKYLLKQKTYMPTDGLDAWVVPTRAPHTLANPYDEEAKVFITFTLAFYINYFKSLDSMAEEGKPVSKEANIDAMLNHATIPLARYEVHVPQ
ncbi:hypothetical protein LTR28_001221 [Elasticomyces elasticus]|nr:hypothetical protein LTR28_001221 [Elasticomyces elasticus]